MTFAALFVPANPKNEYVLVSPFDVQDMGDLDKISFTEDLGEFGAR